MAVKQVMMLLMMVVRKKVMMMMAKMMMGMMIIMVIMMIVMMTMSRITRSTGSYTNAVYLARRTDIVQGLRREWGCCDDGDK